MRLIVVLLRNGSVAFHQKNPFVIGLGIKIVGPCLVNFHLIIAGIKLDQNLALLDKLVVVHQHGNHRSSHARTDVVDVAGGIGVVGGRVMAGVNIIERPQRD